MTLGGRPTRRLTGLMDDDGDPARHRAARRPARARRGRGDRGPPAARPVHRRARRRRPRRRRRAPARPAIPPVDVTPELVLLVLLPGLVFEAALPARGSPSSVAGSAGSLLLAIPGVLVSAAVVAVVLSVGDRPARSTSRSSSGRWSRRPTRPPSSRRSSACACRRRSSTMVDGESLLNDGTGLVLFAIALQRRRRAGRPGEAVVDVRRRRSPSASRSGSATGYVGARVIELVDDHLIELTISVVLAYGSLPARRRARLSGRHRDGDRRRSCSATWARARAHVARPARTPIDTVWEFLAYLLTAVVFLLVGLAIPPARLLDSHRADRAGPSSAILVGRALVVYVMLGGVARLAPVPGSPRRDPDGLAARPVLGGLRGAVAVAMALSLPGRRPAARPPPGDHLRGRPVHAAGPGHDRRPARSAIRVEPTASRSPPTPGGGRHRRPSGGGRALAGRCRRLGRHAAARSCAGCSSTSVAVLAPDRRPVEPLDVLEVVPGDLAERPARVAAEVEDAARRVARVAARRPRGPRPRASTRRSRRPVETARRPVARDRPRAAAASGGAAGRRAAVTAPGADGAARRRRAAPGRRRPRRGRTPRARPGRRSAPRPR